VKIPEEILQSTFAARFLEGEAADTARSLFRTQDTIISEFLSSETAITEKLTAELGLSIQTLVELRDWAHSLQDWQIRNFEKLFFGGVLNLTQVPYIVGPVAKRMSELQESSTCCHGVCSPPIASLRRKQKSAASTMKMQS